MPEKRVTKPKAKAKAAAAAAEPQAALDVARATILGISEAEAIEIAGMSTALEGANLVAKDVSEIATVFGKTNTEAKMTVSAPSITGLQASVLFVNAKAYLRVNWGDGKEDTYYSSLGGAKTHTYAVAGTYKITGTTFAAAASASATVA